MNELNNAVNDARAMKDTLEKQNVKVFYVKDCTITELTEVQEKYINYIEPGDAALFFFAGHGCTFKNAPRMMTIVEDDDRLSKNSLNLYVLLAK